MPGRVRPTMSQDGKMRYTLMIPVRISTAMIKWIRERTGWGETRTLAWVREQLELQDNSGWYVPTWTAESKQLEWSHVDDVNELPDDNSEAFEEPRS